jgi:pyruvate,water dikinase
MDGADVELVNGFQFGRPKTVIEGRAGESRTEFETRVSRMPEALERFRNAEETLRTRRWREDLAAWDLHWKPSVMATNEALAAVQPSTLDDTGLSDFVRACLDQWFLAVAVHHIPNGVFMVPSGMLVAFVKEVVGSAPGEAINLLAGTIDVSGPASPEPTALRDAVRADPAAYRRVQSSEPSPALIDTLRTWPGETGAAVRRYLRRTGYLFGSSLDVVEPCGLERPELLANLMHDVITSEAPKARPGPDLDSWRQRVPGERWDEFVELVEEARFSYRIRDERGVYANGPARGILRMALLEAGRRMVLRGRLSDAEDILEIESRELPGLLYGETSPTASELAARRAFRLAGAGIDVPDTLGAPDAPPINVEWLPEAARTLAQGAAATAPLGVTGGAARGAGIEGNMLKGAAAAPGHAQGPARIVRSLDDLDLVEPGDVVVTATTTSSFNPVFPLLAAIVTDFGGPLSHAAIMAREFGIPCVAGCGKATALVADGQWVSVDGTAGTVTLA